MSSVRPPRRASASNKPAPPLTIQGHVATLAVILANRLRSAASSHYRKTHNMGIVEWRILMCLGQSPLISAPQVSRITDLNKAAVSRSLTGLRRKGWVTIIRKTEKSRGGKIALTEAGQSLYEELLEEAIERQRKLLAPLAPEERDILVELLRKLIDHVPEWARAKS